MKTRAMTVLFITAGITVTPAWAGMVNGGAGTPARMESSGEIQRVGFEPGKVEDGRTIFAQVCSACHTDKPNKHKIGPSLFGVIGRHAGSAPGFDYSVAMKAAPLTWDIDTLDRYLTDPKAVVPGNKMPYMGVKNDERRKDVIAYLNTLQ